jgi:hypothetical protein
VIVQNLSKRLSANDVIRGDTSNATYKVIDTGYTKIIALNVFTTPDPINAQPDDEFGFSETITEFPNTL